VSERAFPDALPCENTHRLYILYATYLTPREGCVETLAVRGRLASTLAGREEALQAQRQGEAQMNAARQREQESVRLGGCHPSLTYLPKHHTVHAHVCNAHDLVGGVVGSRRGGAGAAGGRGPGYGGRRRGCRGGAVGCGERGDGGGGGAAA
jgi:hypothetical protein